MTKTVENPVAPALQRAATILILALAVGTPAMADERFAAFLAANPPIDNVVCAYTTTATSSLYPGETRSERFSPDNGWRLLAIDGEPPSEQALKDYADEATERNRQRQQPADLAFAEMLLPDTVRVIDEDQHTIVFAFTPDSPEGGRARAMMKKMTGQLTVAKDDMRPLRYVAELDEPTSPMPTMKIAEFRQEMTFAVEPTLSASLMASMAFRMRGKAFVFRKIDSEANIEVSDYDCRPDPSTE